MKLETHIATPGPVIVTVWHSGTHSLLNEVKERQMHCSTVAKKKIQDPDYGPFITTYRDPHRVAASWYNRGEIECDGVSHWISQWDCYRELVKVADIVPITRLNSKMHTSNDKLNLHKALDNKDFDYYYSIVDKYLVTYAIDCCKGLDEQIRKEQDPTA